MGLSQRQLRVGELVRHALSEILSRGDVRDPALARTVVTVPEVRMSPDLKWATVLVMPLGGAHREEALKGLERERGALRRELAKRVKLKFLPDLRFVLDTRYDDDDRIAALLHRPEVQADLARGDADDGAGTETADGNADHGRGGRA